MGLSKKKKSFWIESWNISLWEQVLRIWTKNISVCSLLGFLDKMMRMCCVFYCRMGMKFSSGSKEAHSWRSSWMLIVTDNLWTSTRLHSCLMVVVFGENKPLMRYLSHFNLILELESNAPVRGWLMLLSFLCFTARNGGWRRDRCNVAPNWRCFCLSNELVVLRLKQGF